MLTLEQPAEAQAVLQTNPTTDLKRMWAVCKLVSPILFMSSVFLLEIGTLQAWLQERLFSAKTILLLLFAAAFPFALVFGLVLLLKLIACLPFPATKGPKRTIRLDDRGLKLSQTKYDRVRWNQVQRWFFAPIPGSSAWTEVTVEYKLGKVARRYWSLILDARQQKPQLISELEYLRQTDRSTASIVELVGQMPPPPLNSSGIWAAVLAYFLFVHGFPMLVFGLVPRDGRSNDLNYSPAAKKRLERLVTPVIRTFNIQTTEQFRRLFWISGAVLTASGVGISFWGTRRSNQRAREINRDYDAVLEEITRR